MEAWQEGLCSQCSHRNPDIASPLPNRWRRPMLTTVTGRHLSRQQDLPDRADAITSLTPVEVLAVDAARSR